MTEAPAPTIIIANGTEGDAGRRLADEIVVRVDVAYLDVRDDLRRVAGSGFLLSIAETTFVITAGHNIAHHAIDEVSIWFPRRVAPVKNPAPAIVRMQSKDDPDVGWIELEATSRALWSHMRPLTLRNVEVDAPHAGDDLLLLGAPTAMSTVVNTAETHQAVGVFTRAVACPANPNRSGFHVEYGTRLAVAGADRTIAMPHPDGVSGGPVLRRDIAVRRVVGTASAFFEPSRAERCECMRSVLELLGAHPTELVRDEVGRMLDGR